MDAGDVRLLLHHAAHGAGIAVVPFHEIVHRLKAGRGLDGLFLRKVPLLRSLGNQGCEFLDPGLSLVLFLGGVRNLVDSLPQSLRGLLGLAVRLIGVGAEF